MTQMAQREGVTEALKAENQMISVTKRFKTLQIIAFHLEGSP